MQSSLPTSSELTELLPFLTPQEREELDSLLMVSPIWNPQAGKQTMAYYSPADELLYGGSAGSGKSDLELGLAVTAHRRSIIFRREFPQLKGLIDRSHEILDGTGAVYNGSEYTWKNIPGDRKIEFGSVQYLDDWRKYQGRPHDLVEFDELANFLKGQYLALIGWNRTTIPWQRCRVVGATNPPTDADGEWIIERWAPWLDDQNAYPAKSGELRWYAMIDGKDTPVDGPEEFKHKSEIIKPKSRTFISARLSDNPILEATGYEATLQAFPEPLRSMMLYGLFNVGRTDNPWQVIPTAWVKAAQARWTPIKPAGMAMTALGADVARGGDDKMVLSPRYGNWFDELLKYPGAICNTGPAGAGLIISALKGAPAINLDVIGIGSSVYDFLKSGKVKNVNPVNFAEKSEMLDRSKKYKMRNVRAAAYWAMREALDPDLGDNLALPPDPELLADLTAPRWSVTASGIIIEDKDDIIKRLGRSPDCGDAVVLAHYQGGRASTWDDLGGLGKLENYQSRWK